MISKWKVIEGILLSSNLLIFTYILKGFLCSPKSRQQIMARLSPTPSGSSSTVFHQHFNMHPGTFSIPSSDRSPYICSNRANLEVQEDKCPARTKKTATKPSQQCSRSNKSQQETGDHQGTDAEGYYTKTWEQLLEEVCGQHRAMALRDVSLSLTRDTIVRMA